MNIEISSNKRSVTITDHTVGELIALFSPDLVAVRGAVLRGPLGETAWPAFQKLAHDRLRVDVPDIHCPLWARAA